MEFSTTGASWSALNVEGYSMWVNRMFLRDCLGNPSKLGMEVFKRMENRGQAKNGASLST